MSAIDRRRALMALATGMLAGGASLRAPRAGKAGSLRVVAVGGAISEIVMALGRWEVLVGVDTTSLYPAAAMAALPKVGYLRALSAEGILALRPDMLLADADAGPPDVIAQLRGVGLPVRQFAGGRDPRAVIDKIRFVGDALAMTAVAATLSETVKEDLATLAGIVAELADRPKVLFLLSVGSGAPMAAGRDSGAAMIIGLAGGDNALGGFEGYKPIGAEAALAAAPDYLLMMRQSVDRLGGGARVLALPQLAPLEAAKRGRLVAMDGGYLLGFGPRSAHAARDLAAALHPAAAVPALPRRPWTA